MACAEASSARVIKVAVGAANLAFNPAYIPSPGGAVNWIGLGTAYQTLGQLKAGDIGDLAEQSVGDSKKTPEIILDEAPLDNGPNCGDVIKIGPESLTFGVRSINKLVALLASNAVELPSGEVTTVQDTIYKSVLVEYAGKKLRYFPKVNLMEMNTDAQIKEYAEITFEGKIFVTEDYPSGYSDIFFE